METAFAFFKERLFTGLFIVQAFCGHGQRLTRPLRVHLKYSKYPKIEDHIKELEEALNGNFGLDVTFTKERGPLFDNNYEVWIVGGRLLWSRRNGDGFMDSYDKRQKVVQAVKTALSDACPASCGCMCPRCNMQHL
jgi:hypothetical protein